MKRDNLRFVLIPFNRLSDQGLLICKINLPTKHLFKLFNSFRQFEGRN